MNVPLLDAGGVLLFGYVVILFLVTATVIEAFVMTFMKFNKVGKCFLDAVLLNITSLVIGYLLLGFAETISNKFGNTLQDFVMIMIMFLITMLIEGGLLLLLNRGKRAKQVWLTTFVMNLVSYLILWAFLKA